jgi:hypothetical protein
MKKFRINRVYRQTAPDAEGHGGGSGPAEPPETPAEEPTSEAPPDDGNDRIPEGESLWETLSREIDDDDSLEDEPTSPPETPPADDEDETPPESPAETPPAETPPETPPEEPAPETPPAEQPPREETPPAEPESPQPSFEEQRAEAKKKMQESILKHYNFSDEDALRFVTDPKSFLDMQARMWTDMWYGMQDFLTQQMPEYIDQGMQEREARNEYVDKFFEAWPKLNRKDHGATVAQVAKTYSQVNPGATEEEVVRFVGMQAMLMHGMSPDMTPVQETTPPAAPPQTPPATPPAEPPAPGYQPPSPSGAGGKPSSGNIWEAMAEELLEDDSE